MKRKKRRLWWSIPVLVLIGATSAAFLVNGKSRSVRVKVTSPQVGTVEEIITASSVGTVEARRTATVSAETSGRVLSIKVRPGRKQDSHAPSGAPIVLIDESDIVAEQDIIRRNIQTQRLRRERAQLRIKQVETEYDRLKNTDETLRALDKLRKEIEIARKDEEIAASTIESLQANLARIELQKRKAIVVSPFAGIISELHVEEGELVSPGKPLFTILCDGPLLIRAPIDEVDRARIDRSKPARVTFDGYRDADGNSTRFPAVVEEIMASASPDRKNNRTIDIKVRVPNMPGGIVSGMSAHVEIIVDSKVNGLWIHTHLVHEEKDGSGKYVYIVEGDRARKVPIRTGLGNWETTEILEGLTPENRVVNPLYFEEDQSIENGTPVEIVE
jgi:HlyD family secretion protein